MAMSKQMLLLVLLLSVQGSNADHGAVAAPAVGQAPPAPIAQRRLTVPESVHDKQEVVTVPVSSDLEKEVDCEPSGPCQHCGGQDSDSLPECIATGRRQAFRCLSPEGGATESSDGDTEEGGGGGGSFTVYRSCRRTDDEEAFRLLRFQLFCFMGGIASFVQVRKQKTLSASLFDQRKQHHQSTAAAVEMVETQSLVSNISRDEEGDVV